MKTIRGVVGASSLWMVTTSVNGLQIGPFLVVARNIKQAKYLAHEIVGDEVDIDYQIEEVLP